MEIEEKKKELGKMLYNEMHLNNIKLEIISVLSEKNISQNTIGFCRTKLDEIEKLLYFGVKR